MVSTNRTGLIYGVGISDADYPVTKHTRVGDKSKRIWMCPYYSRWSNMVKRVHCKAAHKTDKIYSTVSICEEWLTFSNFKAWMETQDWEGKHLDKDLLGDGKSYSPETCCFISPFTNTFLTNSISSITGKYFGVVTRNQGFKSSYRDPFQRKPIGLGQFKCHTSAQIAWCHAKHEVSCRVAELEDDPRVVEALRTRFIP